MGVIDLTVLPTGLPNSDDLFERIAQDLAQTGYSIQLQALPLALQAALENQLMSMDTHDFAPAGIGRQQQFAQNQLIRRDEISWINATTAAGKYWLDWMGQLQIYLNRRLFLGLFSMESHYAHYAKGDFYKRHYDTFRGQSNRVLSVVTYLNADWHQDDGGQIVLYHSDADQRGIQILPTLGTMVIFLSEEFPHEVLAAKRDRYSIASWYRLNNSIRGQIDPPR